MISIIVPVYNAEKYLRDCVKSLINQTYTEIEVLLIDDGSSDGSSILCDELESIDNRIRSFHKENGGASSARKYGVEVSAGEWIMFVDADDTVTPNSLELMLSLDNQCDIIAGAINKDGKLFGHRNDGLISREDYVCALLEVRTTDGPVAKLIKRKLFDGILWDTSREITINEDMLMLIALSKNANKILLNSEIISYNYISRVGSASTTYSMSFDVWIKLFNLIDNQIKDLYLIKPKIRESFLIYKLERIYNFIKYSDKGIRQSSYLTSLIDETRQFELGNSYKHVLKLLANPHARWWTHFLYKYKIYQICLVLSGKARLKIE